MSAVRQAFVGFGSNLGDRPATLASAAAALRAVAGVGRLECSPVYETAPVGLIDQPAFLNLVAGLETTLAPEVLLDALQAIELRFGRTRTVRWGPRTLDLDLLVFEGERREGDRLTLPHPRMLERAFVRTPLADVLRLPPFAGARWNELRATLDAIPLPSVEEIRPFAAALPPPAAM